MDNKKTLRTLGAWPVTIRDVIVKEPSSFRGKQYPAKVVIVFESEDGRFIDMNCKFPLAENKWDERKLNKLKGVCKVAKTSELKGKTCVVIVTPREWEGKVFWDVENAYDPKYLKGEADLLDAALDGVDDLFAGAKVTNAKDPIDEIDF